MFKKLSKLFSGEGGAGSTDAASVDYEGFQITVAPMKENAGYRVAARIEKTVDGQTKTHQLIRADVCNSHEEAERVSLLKAQALIDQQGDDIF